ncbi:Hypothetical predicted protein [Mytilus galloprovincialis]|uniref:Mab-21-like HhH/H2TH-like domain-containing protein n=1 Tax=Mytilus galloprovincialis TaxID=29158 RepID=A0A8B6C1U3_MYTGA|nr:Hypothetical predicted protein [Mytilus galloprovincialis]
MNAVRDNLQSNKDVTFITSGSFGEGLEMRGSDLDIMIVSYRHNVVYEDVQTCFNPKMTYLLMETDDVKPCYTLLKLEKNRSPKDFIFFEDQNDNQYFSSALFKQCLLSDVTNTIHGPCLSNTTVELDLAVCLHCKTWIYPALQWITRSSNSWPSNDIKQSIIKHGVLFVPIGVKGSPKEDIEWRVSFSVGEKLLINTFTHTQLLCYALFKIVLKDVVATYSEYKDLLCSYFLKTIMFWLSEELPQSVWKPYNMIPCFMRCFNRLIYCVEHSVCLHYFIPDNNLFENKIEGRSREILLEKLSTLYSYGWRCILFSDQISNFYVSIWNFQLEPRIFYVDDVNKILNSTFTNCNNLRFKTLSVQKTFENGLCQTLRCQQPSIKDVYKYFISMCSSGHAQRVSLDTTLSNNKNLNKQYKSCLSTLLQNVYHDAVSGWLMLASFFYKTKQYSKALYVIRYSISKCTPEKLFPYSTISDDQLLNLNSCQKTSFVKLGKIMLVDDIRFESDSLLAPDELQMVDSISDDLLLFPSTAYAYFLEFLCHYHLNYDRQCQDSIQGLKLVIEENYLITSRNMLEANSYILLGIALQLFGHYESARQAFLQYDYWSVE